MPEQQSPLLDAGPEAAIVEIVRRYEPELEPAEILDAVMTIAQPRWRRDLAARLDADPRMLVSERPRRPQTAERLVKALLERGATRVVPPRRDWLPTATCSTCGRSGPSRFAATDAPLCDPCYQKGKPRQACTRCGKDRQVAARTDGGLPVCRGCAASHAACAGCGTVHKVTGRTPDGEPLCYTCWHKHPVSYRPCTSCSAVQHLHSGGRCQTCVAVADLRVLLGGPASAMRPEMEPVFRALADAQPRALLRWIHHHPARRVILEHLRDGTGPITHEVLDQCQPPKVVQHIRGILVAGGVLPERDEHMIRLERWIKRTATAVLDPDEHQVLTSYAAWHHLRRLRQRGSDRFVTTGQVDGVKNEIKAAIGFLTWLRDNDLSLATCTQDHLDTWLAEGPDGRLLVRNFLIWAAGRKRCRRLESPSYRSNLTGEAMEPDERWALLRRVLHDNEVYVADKAAALLLLLFAQPASRSVQLKVDDVLDDGTSVKLALGKAPVEVPPPLDDLLRQLVQRRRGRRVVTNPEHQSQWLFPGQYPSRPLSPTHLAVRLRAIGVEPRRVKGAALIDMAADLPPFVFARLLGFHQNTADNWQRDTAGFGAEYAAEISRR